MTAFIGKAALKCGHRRKAEAESILPLESQTVFAQAQEKLVANTLSFIHI